MLAATLKDCPGQTLEECFSPPPEFNDTVSDIYTRHRDGTPEAWDPEGDPEVLYVDFETANENIHHLSECHPNAVLPDADPGADGTHKSGRCTDPAKVCKPLFPKFHICVVADKVHWTERVYGVLTPYYETMIGAPLDSFVDMTQLDIPDGLWLLMIQVALQTLNANLASHYKVGEDCFLEFY